MVMIRVLTKDYQPAMENAFACALGMASNKSGWALDHIEEQFTLLTGGILIADDLDKSRFVAVDFPSESHITHLLLRWS
jgi:hypothetical protein